MSTIIDTSREGQLFSKGFVLKAYKTLLVSHIKILHYLIKWLIKSTYGP